MYKVRFVFGSKHNQFIDITDYKLEREISFAGQTQAIIFSFSKGEKFLGRPIFYKETYVPVNIIKPKHSWSMEYWLKEKARGSTMVIYKWGWFSDEEAYNMVKDNQLPPEQFF